MFEYCYDAETGEVDEGAEKQLAEYKAEILGADLEKLCKVRVNLMAKAEAIKFVFRLKFVCGWQKRKLNELTALFYLP